MRSINFYNSEPKIQKLGFIRQKFLKEKKIPAIVAFSFIAFISIYFALNTVRTHETAKQDTISMFRVINPWRYLKQKFEERFIVINTECKYKTKIDPLKFYQRFNCTSHPLCALNRKTDLLYRREHYACTDFQKCVTAVVKSSGERDEKLVELIASLDEYYPEMAIVIIADDNLIDITCKLQTILRYNQKIYYKRLPEIVGLSHGRMIGLSYVKTPFFLLLDDDFVFMNRTNIEKLFQLLINTNVGLVAGNADGCDYFGLLRFEDNGQTRYVTNHQRAVYSELPGYPGCFHVDIAKNFFVAKKDVILSFGGWTKALKIAEHQDFFFKLKLNNIPVALCPNVYIYHKQVKDRIKTERLNRFKYYFDLFLDKWNISATKHFEND